MSGGGGGGGRGSGRDCPPAAAQAAVPVNQPEVERAGRSVGGGGFPFNLMVGVSWLPVAAVVAAVIVAVVVTAVVTAVVATTVLIVLGESVGGRAHCAPPPEAKAAQQGPAAVHVAAAKPHKAAVAAPTAVAATAAADAAALCRHVWLRQQKTGVVFLTQEVVRQQVRRGCHAPSPVPPAPIRECDGTRVSVTVAQGAW